MKNYDETVNSVMEKINEYEIERKHKRKVLARTVGSLCCFCLTVLIGVGVWQSGIFGTETPIISESSAVGDNNSGTSQNQYESEQSNNNEKNQILIQKVEKLPENSTKMLIALMTDDFISMNCDEINEYYGLNVFPTVPSDLEDKDRNLGIYKRKINGELYWDTNRISYANADSSRCVVVNVDKNCIPFDFCDLFGNIQTRSEINNVEVGIARTPIGELYAEFMYQNTGFRIFAYGLTQDEFIGIITSIIE